MRRWCVALPAGALVVALLAGCVPTAAALPADGGVHVVQVRDRTASTDALVQVKRVPQAASVTEWTVERVDPAGSTVGMSWVDGPSPECGQVDEVEVVERGDSVVVGLIDTARNPESNCVAVGVARHFDLRLSRPLGGRALLEPVTGVNDGLPHFAALPAPLPPCTTNGSPIDAPIGMPGAGHVLAPVEAVDATVCRTAWPHGVARTTQVRIEGRAAVRRLADLLNTATDARPLSDATACTVRRPGAWYAVYFTGHDLQVEVLVDEINCGSVQNGSLLARTTPAIHAALAAAFAPS